MTAAQAPTGTTPRRTGAETTEVVLAAALAEMAASGVDQATLPRVAGRAGLSVGPLYSRFDDTDDLVAALWTDRLGDHFDRILRETAVWLVTGDVGEVAWLERELTTPSTLSLATLEVLATVRRYPYAADQVVADASRSFREFVAAVQPIPQATAGYALASLLGSMLLHDLLAPKARGTTHARLTVARDVTRLRPSEEVSTPFTTTVPVPVVTGQGDVPDVFLNAALEVIARGGFEHASANRIARAAGLSASRVYAHFSSKHELAAQAITAIIDLVVGVNALAFVGVDRTTYQQMVLAAGRALCDPASLPARRLRLECLLAARHHPDLHATARRAFDRAERSVTDTFAALAPHGDAAALSTARTLWHLVRNFGFGVLVLHETTGALTPDLDVTPLALALPSVYEDYVLAPLGL